MADHCWICGKDTDQTSYMVIDGDDTMDFCPPCGDKKTLTDSFTGETATLREIYENDLSTSTISAPNGKPIVCTNMDKDWYDQDWGAS